MCSTFFYVLSTLYDKVKGCMWNYVCIINKLLILRRNMTICIWEDENLTRVIYVHRTPVGLESQCNFIYFFEIHWWALIINAISFLLNVEKIVSFCGFGWSRSAKGYPNNWICYKFILIYISSVDQTNKLVIYFKTLLSRLH